MILGPSALAGHLQLRGRWDYVGIRLILRWCEISNGFVGSVCSVGGWKLAWASILAKLFLHMITRSLPTWLNFGLVHLGNLQLNSLTVKY